MNPIPIKDFIWQSLKVCKGLLAAQRRYLEGKCAKFRRTDYPRYVTDEIGVSAIRGNDDTSHCGKCDTAILPDHGTPLLEFTAAA